MTNHLPSSQPTETHRSSGKSYRREKSASDESQDCTPDTAPKAVTAKKNTASSGFTRAIRLLEEIAAHGPLRFAELQDRLSLPKASLNRALTDLQLERMIVFDERSLTYRSGFRVLEIANQIWSRSDLRSIARDQLENLCAMSNETVQLSVLADTHAVYLDSVESSNNVRMSMNYGTKVPVYCTGAGKSLLAWCPVEEQREIISRISFAVYTPNTITDPDQLMKELATIHSQGYADDNEEHFAGIRCVAAPITTSDGKAIAAISITAPTFRIEDAQVSQWRSWLVDATKEISARIAPVAHRL